MKNKAKNITGYLFIINLLHISLCFGTNVLKNFELFNNITIYILIYSVQIIIWFMMSIIALLGLKTTKGSHLFAFSMLALLPMIIITSISASIGFTTDIHNSDWSSFFFIGSTVNFFNRPATMLMLVIKESAYLLYGANLLILFVVSLLGGSIGLNSNKVKIRKLQAKQAKKEVERKTEVTELPKSHRTRTKNVDKIIKESKNASKEKKVEPAPKSKEQILKTSEEIKEEEPQEESEKIKLK